MVMEDSLSDWGECSLTEESDQREPVAWLCVRLLGARKGCSYTLADRPSVEGRREGTRSSGGGGGKEPLPGKKVCRRKALTDRHEEKALAVPCLWVCEVFTSSTLAGKCWCSS